MSDVTSLSPSRLASYAECCRKFDYDYVQEIETPDETGLYLNQGLAYHGTIEAVCEETDPDDDAATIRDRAFSAFDAQWEEHLDPEEYESRSHQTYQRAENRAAIAAFFDPEDGDGIDHARRSVATEERVECVRDGLGLHGRVDNVLRTEDGLHLIDYKRNLKGVLGSWSGDRLVDHLEGEAHEATRVKNAFQTAAYVEGIQESQYFEDGMDVRFSFYGLLHDTEHTGTPAGYDVTVSGKARETTEVYEEYHDTIWTLIEMAHEGITTEAYDPVAFELVHEEACPDCEYSQQCPDYLEAVRR